MGEISARFIVGANRTAEEGLRVMKAAQLLVAQSRTQGLPLEALGGGGRYFALPDGSI